MSNDKDKDKKKVIRKEKKTVTYDDGSEITTYIYFDENGIPCVDQSQPC